MQVCNGICLHIPPSLPAVSLYCQETAADVVVLRWHQSTSLTPLPPKQRSQTTLDLFICAPGLLGCAAVSLLYLWCWSPSGSKCANTTVLLLWTTSAKNPAVWLWADGDLQSRCGTDVSDNLPPYTCMNPHCPVDLELKNLWPQRVSVHDQRPLCSSMCSPHYGLPSCIFCSWHRPLQLWYVMLAQGFTCSRPW